MSYFGHLVFAGSLGATYSYLGHTHFGFSQPLCILAAGICTLGGLLPDLDRLNEDSNSTIRELFSLAAAGGSILLLRRLQYLHLEGEELILALGGVFLGVRYGFLLLVKQLSVHRGMFHSIPATAIAGLAVYLIFHHPDPTRRIFVAVAVMVGFLSHLLLDQFNVGTISEAKEKANGVVGSAMKFYSKSKWATGLCYSILGGMGYLTKIDAGSDQNWKADLSKGIEIVKQIEETAEKYKTQAGDMMPKAGESTGRTVPATPTGRPRGESETGSHSRTTETSRNRP